VISSPKQFQLIRTTGLLYEKNIAAWAGLFQLLSAAERATVFGVPKKTMFLTRLQLVTCDWLYAKLQN
jgi:hypothetical protein